MALLKPEKKVEKEQVRLNIEKSILAEAKAYAEFAGFNKIDEFFEQAAQKIFKMDKEWKTRQESNITPT